MLYEGQELEPEQIVARLQSELQSAKPSKQVLDKLGANPKTRARLLALMKEDNPDLIIPEIDAAQPVLDKISALEKRVEEKEKAEAEALAKREKEDGDRTAKAQIDKGRGWLKSRGYLDDGVEKIEKLMQERGIPDYEAAALLFEKSQPKDEPIIPSNLGRTWDLFDTSKPEDDPWRKIFQHARGPGADRAIKNAQWTEIDKTLKEIRREGARL